MNSLCLGSVSALDLRANLPPAERAFARVPEGLLADAFITDAFNNGSFLITIPGLSCDGGFCAPDVTR